MWFDIEIVHVKLEPGNSKLCGHSKQATKRPGKFCYKIGLKATMYDMSKEIILSQTQEK